MGITKVASYVCVSMRNRLKRSETKEKQSELGTFVFSTIDYKKKPRTVRRNLLHIYTYYMYITFIMRQRQVKSTAFSHWVQRGMNVWNIFLKLDWFSFFIKIDWYCDWWSSIVWKMSTLIINEFKLVLLLLLLMVIMTRAQGRVFLFYLDMVSF